MNRIRELRRAKGYSQKELGDKLGKSLSAISKWELAISQPSFEDLDALCEILECSLGYLLGHEEVNAFRSQSFADGGDASPNDLEQAKLFWERYQKAPPKTKRAIDALLEEEQS